MRALWMTHVFMSRVVSSAMTAVRGRNSWRNKLIKSSSSGRVRCNATRASAMKRNPFSKGGSIANKASSDGMLPGVSDASGESVNVIAELGAEGKKSVVTFIRHFG